MWNVCIAVLMGVIMARTKLGVHWIPRHTDGDDIVVVERWNPNVVKIVDPDPNLVRDVAQRTTSTIVLRNHPLSEQHDNMLQDPAATGTYHAGVWRKYISDNGLQEYEHRFLVEGINEPRVWDPGVDEALNVYTVSFLDELKRLGLRGVALNFSVGWPRNDGPNLPPRWDLYEPTLEAIRRGDHVLGLHEYWSHNGIDEGWGWFAGRYEQCPWNVPIFIGEVGLDEAVIDGSLSFDRRGWKAWLNKEEYMGMLHEYDVRICRDPRIIGAVIFTYDYSGPEWKTFDVRDGLRWELVDYAENTVLPDPVQPPVEKPIASGVVIAVALNVRPSPNLDNRPVDVLYEGDRVDIYEEAWGDGYNWYRIGKDRWVAADYVDVSEVGGDPLELFDDVFWPLPGRSTVTQRFLEHPDWYQRQYGIPGHNGIDIVGEDGAPVLAIADGIVEWVDEDPGGYGVYVRLSHPTLKYRNGFVSSFYAHLDHAVVQRGQMVRAGDKIGVQGNTGNSTGPHLHFELRLIDGAGNYIKVNPDLGKGRFDPYAFFVERGLLAPTGAIQFAV